jgi:hypothetical protein
MARWELREPHYLFTEPGTKWEYIETDRMTGRQLRKQYDVPQYFHHEYESDWTEFTILANGARHSGRVVVSDGHNPGPRDIIFKGSPTPGMKPLDDEAIAITAKFKDKWNLPDKMFDLNNPGDYATNLADHFVQMQDKVNMQMTKLEESRVQNADKFQESMLAMMQQNQKILEMLAVKSSGEPNGEEGSTGQDNPRSAGAVRRRGRRFGYRRTQGARPGRPRLAEPSASAGAAAEERGGGDADPSAAGDATPL